MYFSRINSESFQEVSNNIKVPRGDVTLRHCLINTVVLSSLKQDSCPLTSTLQWSKHHTSRRNQLRFWGFYYLFSMPRVTYGRGVTSTSC